MSIEAMKHALEFIYSVKVHPTQIATRNALHTALRAAIEQAEKPVAWMWSDGTTTSDPDRADGTWTPLYTAPRQWVELTDDEARALVNRATFGDKTNWQALVYMVDAKLKEKNGG